ncbi:MAG: hypothetical protein EOM91_10415 [Sphingobacteriia bacterium]|jgi:hypothetical protein|nr:hypothetical protein [Sphingobacteriia bacterium]
MQKRSRAFILERSTSSLFLGTILICAAAGAVAQSEVYEGSEIVVESVTQDDYDDADGAVEETVVEDAVLEDTVVDETVVDDTVVDETVQEEVIIQSVDVSQALAPPYDPANPQQPLLQPMQEESADTIMSMEQDTFSAD